MAPSIVLPETFTRAVDGLRSATPRDEIVLEEVGAPQRLAPYAFALSAVVLRDDEDVATGRLILLHDPAGHEAWAGTLRLVTYVTATLEVDLAADPLLPTVAWTWLTDALAVQGAAYRAIGGTVTQTLSTRFGELAATAGTGPAVTMGGTGPRGAVGATGVAAAGGAGLGAVGTTGLAAVSEGAAPTTGDVEIRASWTPQNEDLRAHLLAWCTLLASTAGLPPPGVTALHSRPAGAA